MRLGVLVMGCAWALVAAACSGDDFSSGGGAGAAGSGGATGGGAGSGGGGASGSGGSATGGAAGSTGGSAGSTGGSAGSTGGSAGSTGGSAGSTGGSAGSTGGSAGSTGGSAGSGGTFTGGFPYGSSPNCPSQKPNVDDPCSEHMHCCWSLGADKPLTCTGSTGKWVVNNNGTCCPETAPQVDAACGTLGALGVCCYGSGGINLGFQCSSQDDKWDAASCS